MAYVPTCVFRLHAGLSGSEFLCETHDEAESAHIITSPDSRYRQQCCPARLPVGDALSVVSSASAYSSTLTRCHMTQVDSADVSSKWLLAVLFASRAVSCQGEQYRMCSFLSHRACPLVIGVMCARDSSSNFTLGLITQGTVGQLAKTSILHDWIKLIEGITLPTDADCSSFESTSTTMFADLPIGAEHRKTRMSIWWQTVQCRITPNTVLPPILVQCTVPKDESKAVFESVRVFFVRPAGEKILGGASVKPFVGRSKTSQQEETIASISSDKCSMLGEITNCPKTYKNNAAVTGLKAAALTRFSHESLRLQFVFDDLVVSFAGEHLIAAEIGVRHDFISFVGVLSFTIAPFRVVDSVHG